MSKLTSVKYDSDKPALMRAIQEQWERETPCVSSYKRHEIIYDWKTGALLICIDSQIHLDILDAAISPDPSLTIKAGQCSKNRGSSADFDRNTVSGGAIADPESNFSVYGKME